MPPAPVLLSRTHVPVRARLGAQVTPHGVEFRAWAPHARVVSVVVESATRGEREFMLDAENPGPQMDGYFAARVADAAAGDRYRFRLDGGAPLPDPASRFQPDGPHGASLIVDPHRFAWTDRQWCGVDPAHAVLYELHVGTFTPQGTWNAALAQLGALAALGVSVIEVMPVAEFPGTFGWGYDGVCLFAPYHGYGTPDDMRRFVDAAHALRIGVIVDVVYNHFGPEGNHLRDYSPHWFGTRASEWGDTPNFDGAQSGPVREFYLANAEYWIEEFHADGLRLDATQQVFDTSREHILAAVVRRARAAAGARRTYFIAENEPQHARLVRAPQAGGIGCDAAWNDDFHHALMVALLGKRDAYCLDYRGHAQEILSALKHGFLYQGQRSAWINAARGTPALDLPQSGFVHFLENHDQVANAARGTRLADLAAPADLRAATALLLLGPQTPLIFQGQEYAASQPFLYFADHAGELAAAVRAGRAQFLAQFPPLADEAARAALPDPADPATFRASKLDPSERGSARGMQTLALFRDLLRLRREDEILSGRARTGVDGAVLGAQAFVLRLFGAGGDDRVLLANFGVALKFDTLAEPLLAPPERCRWRQLWSSEESRYGGGGTVAHDDAHGWNLPGHCVFVLRPERVDDTAVATGAP